MLLLQYTETLDMNDMVMIHGIPWPCGVGITEEKVEALTRLPAREDDIFIASFPRSGLFAIYTAISINVVGLKLQAYVTRPNGGLGIDWSFA